MDEEREAQRFKRLTHDHTAHSADATSSPAYVPNVELAREPIALGFILVSSALGF